MASGMEELAGCIQDTLDEVSEFSRSSVSEFDVTDTLTFFMTIALLSEIVFRY